MLNSDVCLVTDVVRKDEDINKKGERRPEDVKTDEKNVEEKASEEKKDEKELQKATENAG